MDKFHNHRNVVITATDEISDVNLEKFIKTNLENFHKGSIIKIFCGHHHQKNQSDNTIEVFEFDARLVQQFKVRYSKNQNCLTINN